MRAIEALISNNNATIITAISYKLPCSRIDLYASSSNHHNNSYHPASPSTITATQATTSATTIADTCMHSCYDRSYQNNQQLQ